MDFVEQFICGRQLGSEVYGYFCFPSIKRGEGPWLHAVDGRRYFDATAGSGAVLLGHQDSRVIAAAQAQLGALVHTGCKLNSVAREAFVAALGEIAPFGGAAVLPAVIGTEAVESALKIARAYTGRKSVVAFEYAFHGKSAGALALTWRSSFKSFSALEQRHVYVAPHPGHQAADDRELCATALLSVRQVFERAAEEKNPPAAIILEPIQVTEGVHDPGPEFVEGVIALAHEFGALAILDEIYTGMGRCGHLFYTHQLAQLARAEGARPAALPDLLIVGKALGNGFPIAAVVGRAEIVNALPAGVQTSTFSGSPLACAAASAVIDIVMRDKVWQASRAVGERALAFLQSASRELPMIANVRGQGTLLAFDLLGEDQAPLPRLATAFVDRALERGVFLFRGGRDEASIKIVPPALLDAQEEEFLLGTLKEVTRDLVRDRSIEHAVR